MTTEQDIRLNLKSRNNRGTAEAFAMFIADPPSVQFYSSVDGKVELKFVLEDEQKFLSAPLQVLKNELGIADTHFNTIY